MFLQSFCPTVLSCGKKCAEKQHSTTLLVRVVDAVVLVSIVGRGWVGAICGLVLDRVAECDPCSFLLLHPHYDQLSTRELLRQDSHMSSALDSRSI